MGFNLGTEDDPIMETVVDPETLEETQVGTGVIATAKGVHIDHIGAMQITAGTYDDEGAELTAPTFDQRHHVNFRLAAPAVNNVDDYGVTKWHKWTMAWTISGSNDGTTWTLLATVAGAAVTDTRDAWTNSYYISQPFSLVS